MLAHWMALNEVQGLSKSGLSLLIIPFFALNLLLNDHSFDALK